MKITTLIFALTTLLFSQFAAATVISISDVGASSTLTGLDADNLINGYGLKGDLHRGQQAMKWLGSKKELPTLTFDLGSVFNVANTEIWNFGTKRSAKNVRIESSIDGVNFDLVSNIKLAKTSKNSIAAQTFDINTIARYMRFDIQSNYGNRYTGLSEVQFFEAPATVPEPGTVLLLLCGLMMIFVNRLNVVKTQTKIVAA